MKENIGTPKLIKSVAENTAETQIKCEAIINAFLEELQKEIIAGNKVVIKNFCTFEVTERPERKGRNMQTGESIIYPPTNVVRFKASKVLKDTVNHK